MVQKFKRTGNKLMSKDKEKFCIQTVTFSKANIICLKSMVKACIFGDLTIQNIKANSKKTLYKERREFISLPINIIMEGSEMEKEMDKEIMSMKMEILSQVSGKMILNSLVITSSKMVTSSKASSKIIS